MLFARGRDRALRHREHAEPVDLRTHPGARAAARRGHGSDAGEAHDPMGVGDHRDPRGVVRHRDRHLLRLGAAAGAGARGHHRVRAAGRAARVLPHPRGAGRCRGRASSRPGEPPSSTSSKRSRTSRRSGGRYHGRHAHPDPSRRRRDRAPRRRAGRLRAAQGHDRGTGGRRAPRPVVRPRRRRRRRGDRSGLRGRIARAAPFHRPRAGPGRLRSLPGDEVRDRARGDRRLLLRLRPARDDRHAPNSRRSTGACGRS